jgi:ABC-type dipeptide/oligopeptide/nickel transport system ATPase subunit
VRKEKLILSSLVLKKQEEQKQRIDGLDAIRDALMNTTKDDKSKEGQEEHAESYNTNKAKRKLVAEEARHVGLVMQHPAFKADPFATIQEHLRNTLAEEKVKQELQEEQRIKKDKVEVEQQKRQKKKKLQGVKKPKKKFKAARYK